MITVKVMRMNADLEPYLWNTLEFKTMEEARAFQMGVAVASGKDVYAKVIEPEKVGGAN